MIFLRFVGLILLSLVMLALQACSPAPSHTLSNEEKIADMYWIYSQFGENYAPLEYKEKRYNFDYEAVKKQYLDDAVKTKTNEEFYGLMYKFVASFKDAHTSASLVNSDLPARTQVGYLGFSGKRKGNNLIVTDLLPTINAKASDYPIRVGDVVSKLDGVALPEVVNNTLLKYRDLGNPESNLTYHMNRLFNHISTLNGLPSKPDAVLTIGRGGKDLDVTIPWVVKDLYAFTHEQAAAAKTATIEQPKKGSMSPEEQVSVFELGSLIAEGKISFVPQVYRNIYPQTPGYSFWNSFVFVDNMPIWTSKIVTDTVKQAALTMHIEEAEFIVDPFAELKKVRTIPENAIFISTSSVFPTYMRAEPILDAQGKPTGATKFVANMFLNSFSPAASEADVITEVSNTLKVLQKNGVKDIIVDMIDNGGGSLDLGMRIAQLFSNEKVTMPGMQFRISETWLDQFQGASLSGPSDPAREVGRRVYQGLKEDQAAGMRLSRVWSAESLLPAVLQPNHELESKFNVVLMVNEMCASMCDIFSAIMKDNKIRPTKRKKIIRSPFFCKAIKKGIARFWSRK